VGVDVSVAGVLCVEPMLQIFCSAKLGKKCFVEVQLKLSRTSFITLICGYDSAVHNF
jgi:hypothetical protein